MSCRPRCPICKSYRRTKSLKATGEELSLPRSTVWSHLKRAGDVAPPAKTPTPDLKAEILAMVNDRLALLEDGTRLAVRTYAPVERVIRPEADNLVEDPAPSGSAVWLGDLHLPWCHEKALDAACRVVGDQKPDVLLLGGDLHDMHSISTHEKDNFIRLQDEIEQSRPYVDRLAALPVGRTVCLMGNHDERVERIGRANPALNALKSLDYAHLTGLPESWAVYADQTHYRLGGPNGILALHGNLSMGPSGGKNIAGRLRDRLRHACIFGHFHYDDIAPRIATYDGRPLWEGHAMGWLGDARRAGGYITKPNWMISIGRLWWDPDGFEVQHHVWDGKRFLVDGRSYRG